MSLLVYAEHVLGDMTARYTTDAAGRVGLWLYPTALRSRLAERRATVANESWARSHSKGRPAIVVEPLVHVKLSCDDQPPQLGPGRTLLWSPSTDRFRLAGQRVADGTVITTLADETGLQIEHRLSAGYAGLTVRSEAVFANRSARPVRLELLTSFSLSGITPLATDDAPGRLRVHRFRSVWSAEGRMTTESIEQLHLERSWAGNMNFSERFGQVGSMPVRGWFPTALVEDTQANVVWGARLAVPTSWQMELGRRFDDVVLAGGLADREFGHWMRTVEHGESFATPHAWLTCVTGADAVEDACDRLVSVDLPAAEAQPAVEQDLPIVYNDYCTSWGEPREDQLLAVADRVAPLGVGYLVIDAGWYMPADSGAHWATSLGDWRAHPSRFPNGLAGTAEAIKKRGLVPGIWMEPEHVAKDSDAFAQTDHMLTRDGRPLTIGVRRAWDLHDPYAAAYIDDRVIRMLREAGFGYVKIDYSETLGIGVDHPDGLGEGLRRQGEGSHAMFDRIKAALPDLVIELVSAGGHRMEASFLQRVAMSSYSDAHETVEIPIIAAAVHRLMLPRQSQIWAVLRHDDTAQRLVYSLAATFLGRMCLSGDILLLDEGQLGLVKRAIDLYRKAVPTIKHGKSRIRGNTGPSWRHPTGWQAVVQTTDVEGLVVIHIFEGAPREFSIPLPGWNIVETLSPLAVEMDGDELRVGGASAFDSQVVLIRK